MIRAKWPRLWKRGGRGLTESIEILSSAWCLISADKSLHWCYLVPFSHQLLLASNRNVIWKRRIWQFFGWEFVRLWFNITIPCFHNTRRKRRKSSFSPALSIHLIWARWVTAVVQYILSPSVSYMSEYIVKREIMLVIFFYHNILNMGWILK